ncbi:Rib/alpha-like domain-containing protein [Corynebacterium timonense]|uniref:Rib/alpha/Esp surface antigen repeat-containing protein n=1 Tax=Corynebacterium timonense TaxID=441500 RepID=A0A1H1VE77_9CORY|nr:Rib/alpha-like domain-containing protein [Corynebacterium timonense]SDS83084.1 Rib/alpha/Esp surface antigen repeat-containing protein [Corynebacterium timonense]
MSKRVTSTLSAGVAAALAAGVVAVPHAHAETKTNLQQPLACNLQLKNPGGIPLGFASAVEGVYNSANKSYSNFKVTLDKTEAPDTVPQGETFDYIIDAGTLSVPASINAAVTANVTRVSQLNIWYQLPQNAELVSFKAEGGAQGLKVEREGARLRVWVPAPTKQSQDVTKWSKNTRNAFAHGGAEATKAGDSFTIAMPKITLKLKATGQPGTKIQAGLPKADANTFSPELPIQFYADASARFVLKINANGFIRCGLSEDDTYWPGENGTNLPADKFSTVTITEARATGMADAHDPRAAGPVTIARGGALPNAENVIANFADLPSGTRAQWESTHTTVGDNQSGRITVTYPDGTTDVVDVTVHVKDAWVPRAQTNPVVVEQGSTIADDSASAYIANADGAPAGTTFEWATKPDTTQPGETTGTVKVTTPDSQAHTITVRFFVQGTGAPNVYIPQVTEEPQKVNVGESVPDDPRYLITNADAAPAGTTFEWAMKPDTATAGSATGTIRVVVPGQPPAERTVNFSVAAVFTPTAKQEATAVDFEADIADADAKAQIANADAAPADTTFRWAEKPDTTKPGYTTGKVEVKVPGQDVIEVTVSYFVRLPESKLLISGENGPIFAPGTVLGLKDKNGHTVNVKADENGAITIRPTDNLMPEQTVTVTAADGMEVRYTLNLEQGTFTRVEHAPDIGAAIAGALLGGVGLLGGLAQIPGVKENVTRFLNNALDPQTAKVADMALPVISAILGLTGLAFLVTAVLPKTNNDGASVTVGDTAFTPVGSSGSSI